MKNQGHKLQKMPNFLELMNHEVSIPGPFEAVLGMFLRERWKEGEGGGRSLIPYLVERKREERVEVEGGITLQTHKIKSFR